MWWILEETVLPPWLVVKAFPWTVIERIALKMDRKHTVMVLGSAESKEENSPE